MAETIPGGVYRDANGEGFHDAEGKPMPPPKGAVQPASAPVSAPTPADVPTPEGSTPDEPVVESLEALNKAELLELAEQRGLEVSPRMSKAELLGLLQGQE